MSPFGRILRTESKLFLRDPAAVITTIAMPTVILVILGLIPALRETDEKFGGQSFLTYFLPSLLVFSLAVAGVNLMPQALAGYRERGVLRRLATTPASPAALLAAQLVVHLLAMLVSAVLLITVGIVAFDVPGPKNPVGFAVTFVLGIGSLLAIGLLVAAVAPSARAAGGLAGVLFMLIMFFGGVYLPRFLLPDFLNRIGAYLPPGVQALFDSWAGGSPQPVHLAIMAGVALAAGTAAAKLFRWQ
ncbi:ABC transporter permease [Micromonospora zhanjiangensis]|uniref:Transport permease protein n=1 Tax=Micromonospora zhanjiangensis TaxID=1522057 RepID=A0ABV8KEX0_9ACTN